MQSANANDNGERFIIYVNRGAAQSTSGYLTEQGGLSVWRHNAKPFLSIVEANAVIESHGWKNTTSVIPGATTAYVAAVNGRMPVLRARSEAR